MNDRPEPKPTAETNGIPTWLQFGPVKSILVVVVFIAALTATIARIQIQYQAPARVFDESNSGLCDFHNGVYFPSRAFRDRLSPYGKPYADQYPTPRPIPFFSPSVLILHLPFAMLPMHMAEVAFFLWLLLLLMLLSWMTVRFSGIRPAWQLVMLVATFIMFSRGGHSTLFTGYFTFELVIGTLVALQFGKSRPFLSAAGLLLASGKPTYVIPLGFLMLARGNWRAVFLGGVLSAAVAAAGFGWLLSASTAGELVDGIRQGQLEHLEDPVELPVNNWLRVDLPAIIAKWVDWNPGELVQLGMMSLLLAPICYLIWRNRNELNDNEGASGVLGAVCCLSVIVTFYHHSYDMLVLVAPCFAIATACQNWKNVANRWRYAVLACCVIPLFNYSTAGIMIDRIAERGDLLHKLVTSVNCTLLVAALVICCGIAVKTRATSISHS